jgi:hypothetical protein
VAGIKVDLGGSPLPDRADLCPGPCCLPDLSRASGINGRDATGQRSAPDGEANAQKGENEQHLDHGVTRIVE